MKEIAPPLLPGLAAVADKYEGFLLDLWGTIHDGYRPLPGVIDALRRLRAGGKRVVIVSNAPRRSAVVIVRMHEIGIPDGLYDAVLSSGEAAHLALRDRSDPVHATLGRRCYHLGPPSDDSALIGLDLDFVRDPTAADFIFATGLAGAAETVADYEPVLVAGAGAKVPMICANPDLVVLRGDAAELCAGALAARYQELGGQVIYHGKPYPPIYALGFEMLQVADRRRIVAIGDSLLTDIAGARASGIDSLLVPGGIHARALAIPIGGVPQPAALSCLYRQYGVRPTALLPGLKW